MASGFDGCSLYAFVRQSTINGLRLAKDRCQSHAMRRLASGFLTLAMLWLGPSLVHGQGVDGSREQESAVEVGVFTNVTGEPADAWIGLGLAETVATDLSEAMMGDAPR